MTANLKCKGPWSRPTAEILPRGPHPSPGSPPGDTLAAGSPLCSRPCPQQPGPVAGPRPCTASPGSAPGPGLTLVQQLVEEQSAGEEEEVGQHLGGDLGVHPELPQEVQGGLVDGHDAAQLLGQLGGRAPAPPALHLERGAFQQGREADVQGLGRQEARCG